MESRPKKIQRAQFTRSNVIGNVPSDLEGQAATIFIFDKKTPKESKRFLKKMAKKIKNPIDFQKLWLIRDSTSGDFLTAEFIFYNAQDGVWLGFQDQGYGMDGDSTYTRTSCDGNNKEKYVIEPKRFTLTPTGWIEVIGSAVDECANLIQQGINTGAEATTADDVDNLLSLLHSQGYKIEDRVVPRKKSEEAKKDNLSLYIINRNPTVSKKVSIEKKPVPEKIITGRSLSLSLSVEMVSQLVCAFDLETLPQNSDAILDIELMKNPVVFIKDGRSYDRDKLISKGYTEKDFYPNLHLKNIITILKSNVSENEKKDSIEQEFKCPLGYSTMISPMISPSGKTYDLNTIGNYLNHGGNLKLFNQAVSRPDPFNTTIHITYNDLIKNVNLEEFINKFMREYRAHYRINN